MEKRFVLVVFFIVTCLMTGFAQQRVILDTDIDSDVDDVGALAMLYNLHNHRIIDLLGVIVTTPAARRAVRKGRY